MKVTEIRNEKVKMSICRRHCYVEENAIKLRKNILEKIRSTCKKYINCFSFCVLGKTNRDEIEEITFIKLSNNIK